MDMSIVRYREGSGLSISRGTGGDAALVCSFFIVVRKFLAAPAYEYGFS